MDNNLKYRLTDLHTIMKGIIATLIQGWILCCLVMGDFRTYDYAVALRAVMTSDFMTAVAADIPWDVLQRVMTRIVNEVDHVNRVFYDLTSKPPGTVELE